MSKITLTNLVNLENQTTAVSAINANNAVLTTALNNTLSRDGTSPNPMGASLDMNNYQVLNCPTPATGQSPLRLEDLSSFVGGGTVTNIPAGGTTGQVLAKSSNTDYAVTWTSESSELASGTNIAITGASPATISVVSNPTFTGTITTTTTNPTATVPILGFESLTNYYGLSSYVTNSATGTTSGTTAVSGQIENLKGGVTSGGWFGARDSIGAETYGAVGVLEPNYASGNGAIGGFFLRSKTTSPIAPNATLYSGHNGVTIVNETNLTSSVSNGAIGLYINALQFPGAANDNTWVIGANIASARDEGLRIGSSSTNGYIPTKPITVYSTAGSLLWYLDNVGATHSAGYYLDQLSSDFKALFYDGTYTEIADSAGVNGVSIGNVADPGNYYNNTTHTFRSRNTATTFASLVTGGLTLGKVGTNAVPLLFANATSGSITVQAPAGALGSSVLTLPIATDTLIGKATTDTLTNKSIDAGQLTGTIVAGRMPAFTGDITTSSGTIVTTLATVNTNTGSWGTATAVPQFTVNGKGLITAAANVTITPAVGSVTGLGTGVATALGVNVGSAGAFVTFNGAGGTPSSMTATNLSGTAASLTAGTATNAVNTGITDDTSTNATVNLTWVTSNSGNLPQKTTSTKLTFNPSTGVLSSTSFTGAGTGLTGTAASLTAGVASAVAVGGITGLATGVGTFLATSTSANLAAALTDETGSGAAMFGTSPVVTTDIRPSSDGGSTSGTSSLRWSTTYTNDITASGQAARTWSLARDVTAATAGQNLTIQAGGAVSAGTDLTGGNLILSAGIATGTAGGVNTTGSAITFLAPQLGGGSSGSDITPTEVVRINNISGFGTINFCGSSSTSGNYAFQGNSSFSIFNVASAGSLLFRVNGSTIMSMTSTIFTTTSSILSTGSGGLGYGTGAGGTVTQATNRTTGVTLSKTTGAITTNNTSLAAGATARFTVTNTTVAATDTIDLSIKSGTTTDQTDVKIQTVAAGSFDIVVANRHLTTAETGAIVINFNVIKGVTS